MLSDADNETLTRTNDGTPMGDLMRRYWIPALLSYELSEPDCPPVRVRLLGEDLVAFKDSNSRIGLVGEFCPHRGTSLWLGRNEECGLRCIFHGWKFDVEGNCVDMMNEPPESTHKEEVKIAAYPTIEEGGVIWAYMGPKDRTPDLPKFEWTQVPDIHRLVTKNRQQCNWLQALEGGIDTAHAPILHRLLTTETSLAGISPTTDFAKGKPPSLEVDMTDYGYRYAGVRDLAEGGTFVRTYHYIMPFHQIRPQQYRFRGGPSENVIAGHMWVPMDDENCMVYNWIYSFDEHPLTVGEMIEKELGRGPGDLLPDFRNIRNRENEWLIDRQAQKTETFTGISGINNQDQAVQESMGSIVDRTKENLSASDMAVVAARRLLLQAARTVADGGDPPGVEGTYYGARALDKTLPEGVKWRDTVLQEMHASR